MLLVKLIMVKKVTDAYPAMHNLAFYGRIIPLEEVLTGKRPSCDFSKDYDALFEKRAANIKGASLFPRLVRQLHVLAVF